MFESILNLEYMLESDTHRRALAFLVCGYHHELNFIDKISKGSTAHHQLKQKFNADKTMPAGLPAVAVPGQEVQAGLIEKILQHPVYQEVEKEYQKIIASGKKPPSWYQLFGGPPNIDQLANKLKRQGLYEIFYRAWSGTVHGQNVVKGNVTKGTDAGVVQIRHPKDAQQVALHACNLILILYQLFIKQRLPAELPKLSIWYKSIQPEIIKLRQT